MQRLRVLHYPVHPLSGITNYILRMWDLVDRSRFEFAFITRFTPDEPFWQRVGHDARIYPVEGVLAEHIEPLLETVSRAIDEGCDILHLHTTHWFGGMPLEKLALKKRVSRVIVHARSAGLESSCSNADHASLCEKHVFYKKRFTTDLATDFCACSSEAADWLFGEQIPRERIYLLPNAVETALYRFQPAVRFQGRTRLDWQKNLVLAHVGRVAEVKNPFFILDIFRAVARKRPDARLLWAGDGPLLETVRRAAADLGDSVCFLGNIKDTWRILQIADAFLLPSLFEGLPVSAIEAQAAGLPCFLSDKITREAAVTPLVRFLPLEAAAESWAQEIINLFADFVRADASEAVAQAGFDVHGQVKILEKLYKGTLTRADCQTVRPLNFVG